MKKFLFTLAALLMAGSLCAEEYLYIDDFEVSQELLAQTAGKNRRMDVPVKAHFDYYVSAWTVELTLPEGVQLKNAVEGADMTLHTLDAVGNDKDIPVTLNTSLENLRFIAANAGAGYYWPEGADPDEDDPVTCGAAKWIGDYAEMFIVTLQFAQDFTGGDLVVRTQPSSGADPRGEVCPKNQDNYKTCVITVEGGTVEPEILAGEIVIGEPTEDGLLAISYTGEEDVTIVVTLNGETVELVDGAIQLVEGINHITVTVSAEGYENKSATAEIEWTAPVVPEVTATPVISIEYNYDEEYATISATGDGTVKLYIDGMLVPNPFVYNFQDEEHEIVVTATAQEDGKEISETATETYVIPAKTPEPPTPEVTDAPVITFEETDDAVIVTATGNGTVILYMDGVEVDNPCTVAKGEEPATYTFTATAQEDGKEISPVTTLEVTVPAVAVEPPYETPAPEVETELTDDALIITATGEGIVTLYIKVYDEDGNLVIDEEITGEGTATYTVDRTDEAQTVAYWAVAQADDEAIPGVSKSEYADVPAKEVTPQEGHVMYVVMVYADGTEEMVPLMIGANGDYVTAYDVIYPLFYNIGNFYYIIDGVKYYATEDAFYNQGEYYVPDATEIQAFLGNAMNNPLGTEGEMTYFVYNGYSYSLGVHIVIDQTTGEEVGYTAYVAQGGPVSVDELNANKTVAGVRYFNMAGQEMQEANGVTIVVTTYTDGTTSAVKVMK
ncbi:MAG: hypothetical protein IKZ92_09060 [Muribaculaceae bacterium]|nr:hypothetical protein [Muribaculaceae bacterium]